jgi:hypothetical protein
VEKAGGKSGWKKRVEKAGGKSGWKKRVEKAGGKSGWKKRVEKVSGDRTRTYNLYLQKILPYLIWPHLITIKS